MTETNGMKSPSKSFDVFEFREEEELAEMAVKKIAPEFESPQSLNGKILSYLLSWPFVTSVDDESTSWYL